MANFSSYKHVEKQRSDRPRVLVAPLDWGLGHATRCIPVIYELQKLDADVWLAGERAQERLLKAEFPDLPFLSLQGYRVMYSRNPSGLWLALLRQMPGLWRSVQREKKWLAEMIRQHQFDLVISDNRFGLWHHSVPCIFMTHQLAIRTSLGKWLDQQARRMNYRFISKFTECWIPDHKEEPNLAGKLSHPTAYPGIPVRYAGILSRLEKGDDRFENDRLFISLSGPEPQRTVWEEKIINEIVRYKGKATVVRGLPDSEKIMPSTNEILFYNHLSSTGFSAEMNNAEWVICRSGYSTVMDLAKMGKKAVLVPTPGQPEQEYLAMHLSEAGFAPFIAQKEFTIAKALELAKAFHYRPMNDRSSGLTGLICDLVENISASKCADRSI